MLFEGSNCVELRYVAITTGDFVAGVENQDGTEGVDVSGLVAEGGSISVCPETSGNPCEVPPTGVSLDIKPGSCPNPFNRNRTGVLPVAPVGPATARPFGSVAPPGPGSDDPHACPRRPQPCEPGRVGEAPRSRPGDG